MKNLLYPSYKYLFLFLSLLAYSCSEIDKNNLNEENLKKEDISLIDYNNENMNLAIENARNTFNVFDSLIDNPDNRYFAIKIGVVTPDGKEHLWVTDVVKDSNKYFGRVDNKPKFTNNLKLHDLIEIPTNFLSDWLVIENQKVIGGGYTINVLRENMTLEERKKFDEKANVIF